MKYRSKNIILTYFSYLLEFIVNSEGKKKKCLDSHSCHLQMAAPKEAWCAKELF